MRNIYRVRFYAGRTSRTRPRSPLRMPPVLGIGVLYRRSGPALSSETGEFVEVAAGPRRMEGWEMRRGPTQADRFHRITISQCWITKRLWRALVGQLPDTFDKDLSGVSAVQHQPSALPARPRSGAYSRLRPA